MSDATLSLAQGFPSIDETVWKSLVEQSLKGGAFDKKINRVAEDGFAIKGLYTTVEQDFAKLNFPQTSWTILQEQHNLCGEDANQAILDDLENGVNGLLLHVGDDVAALDKALVSVMLDLVQLSIRAPENETAVVEKLFSLAGQNQLTANQIKLDVGADPITVAAVSGQLGKGQETQIAELVSLGEKLGSSSKLFNINGAAYHHAGATDGQELAAALSTAVAYLRAMEAQGVSLERAAGLIAFTFAVDSEFFASIAKLRAARQLWSSVLSACGVDVANCPMVITARSADRMFTRYDPWVNMLRGTAACFAGAVGGADAITIMPYDFASGDSSNFSRRIARNVQSILMEESALDKVVDPAAGSSFLEDLTLSLSEAAWSQFQAIEGEGGIEAVLLSGRLQSDVLAARDTRLSKISTRRKPITGVSEFPNIDDEVMSLSLQPQTGHNALSPCNLAADFEALRDRSQTLEAPTVYLATLGDLASFTPRASFAKNFFEAGGIRAMQADSFEASGARIVVICGSDLDYQELAENTARSLTEKGAEKVLLAGSPGDKRAAYETAGISEFIHMGVDLPAILAPVLDLLEKTA